MKTPKNKSKNKNMTEIGQLRTLKSVRKRNVDNIYHKQLTYQQAIYTLPH